MKPLIISLAIAGRENYPYIQKGLIKSLEPFAGKFDTWIFNNYPDTVRSHHQIPYAFKYDLIEKAANDGYSEIMWADATMRILKNPFQLLRQSEKGVVAFDNLGHPLKNYINDTAIKNMGGDNLDGIKQVWGGALLFDMNNIDATFLFQAIQIQIEKGSFYEDRTIREGFISHRHDQATISLLMHQLGYPLLPYGIIAAKKDVTNETVIQYGD